ncbi:MAG: ATP-binding protein [Burkholderiales bacterium]
MDIQTAYLMLGVINLFMGLSAAMILLHRHDRGAVALWCTGAALSGVGAVLFGLRGHVPDLLSLVVAAGLGYFAYLPRAAALMRERGQSMRWARPLLLVGIAFTVLCLNVLFYSPTQRTLFGLVVHMVGALWLASQAWVLGRDRPSHSARLMSSAYVILALGALTRFVSVAAGVSPSNPFVPEVSTVVMLLCATYNAIFSTFGFIGMAFEQARSNELRHARELEREQVVHAQATAHAGELRQMLSERENLLQVLAHEVRQPLHNVAAALKNAEAALQQPEKGEIAATRVSNALSVIGNVTGTLDNTLAAATLLVGRQPIARQDVEIDLLLELTLGDLAPGARQRIQLMPHTDAQTASMDLNLLRLALRNVLLNALAYSPAHSPVVLRVSDSEEPLALVIEVIDQGPGLGQVPAKRLTPAHAVGAQARVSGQGLGLYVVRRVMELHQGQLQSEHAQAQGTVFRLVVTQGVAV